MRLKVLTASFVVFAVILMVGYPWILGPKPHDFLRSEAYVVRAVIYMCAVIFALVGAAISSLMILRRAREEYRIEKEKLLRDLLESSLRDHKKHPPEAQVD